jgi:A118 family predicted phage portal protein
MFQRILGWIRDWIGKMLSTSNVKQALKLDIAVTPIMADALQRWALIYQNQSPWVGGDIKSLNLGAAIASEVARAVTIEMDVQLSGSPRADFLALQMAPVLNNIRTNTEYGVAKGGLMLKPYVRDGAIAVDYVQADMFYPVAFDANQRMTVCVFADQKQIGQHYFTRLEYHTLLSTGYEITNTAWKSSTRDVLGTQVPLESVADWADLEPWARITGVDKPLFAYFKMPFANNIDPTSPLGVSVYARAIDQIQEADETWSAFLWELESAKRALYTDPMAFGKDTNGKPLLPDKRLYRLLDLQSKLGEKGLFEDWTPAIRDINYLNSINAILRKIEFNCGMSYGILSDPQVQALTATEVINSQQRYYANVVDIQKALQDAIDGLLYAMDVWASLGNLAPQGTYSVAYSFDDSIVADDAVQFANDQQTVTQNAMPKYVFLMRNYNLDEATAKQWVAEAQAETPAPTFFGSELGA